MRIELERATLNGSFVPVFICEHPELWRIYPLVWMAGEHGVKCEVITCVRPPDRLAVELAISPQLAESIVSDYRRHRIPDEWNIVERWYGLNPGEGSSHAY